MLCYLVNARNRAESPELSRFPPQHVEFCSVSSQRAGRDFEWAIAQPIVCDYPWHHIDYWRPVVHMCSHFGACVRCSHVLDKTARAAAGPSTFWLCSSQLFLFMPPLALISFTSYGADQRMQESKPNRLRNQDFLNFCLVGPHVGPKAQLEISSFCLTIY